MPPATPTWDSVFDDLRAIEALLVTVEDDAKVLFDLAHTPGSLKQTVESGRGGGRGTSDPTPGMAAGMMTREKAFLRRRARAVAKLVEMSEVLLVEARDTMAEVFYPERHADLPASGDRGTWTSDEAMAEAKAAQARRRRRGEL